MTVGGKTPRKQPWCKQCHAKRMRYKRFRDNQLARKWTRTETDVNKVSRGD